MIELGIFAKTFSRRSLAEVLEAVKAHGFSTMQFNMTCAGLPAMPEKIPTQLAISIGSTCQSMGITMAAVSGTFNMIHPDPKVRQRGLKRLEVIAQSCHTMGTDTITLCTGTRHPTDKWTAHPDNNLPDAWSDLLHTMDKALLIAEKHDIQLAFEPETANVVNSTAKGKRLLEEMKSDRLKVVFDPANLFEQASVAEIKALIVQGLADLGDHVIMAHAKDRVAEGQFTAAGNGIVPFGFFVHQLEAIGFAGPLVAHGLRQGEVTNVHNYLRSLL